MINRRNFLQRSGLVALATPSMAMPVLLKHLPLVNSYQDYDAGLDNFWTRSVLDGSLIMSEVQTSINNVDEIISIRAYSIKVMPYTATEWNRIDISSVIIGKEYEYVLMDTGDRRVNGRIVTSSKVDVLIKARVLCVDNLIPKSPALIGVHRSPETCCAKFKLI